MSELSLSSAAAFDRATAPGRRAARSAAAAASNARAAQRAATSSAIASALSKGAAKRATYAVPNPAARVFAASFDLGYRFGTWLHHYMHNRQDAPQHDLPMPIYSPPVQGGWSPQSHGWELINVNNYCPTIGGVNSAASGGSVCVGTRAGSADKWAAGEGEIIKTSSGGIDTYTMHTYRVFDGYFPIGSTGKFTARYQGSSRWRLRQSAGSPEPDLPRDDPKPAVMLPPAGLEYLPLQLGVQVWANPAAIPMQPFYEPLPWVPPYRALPDAVKYVDVNVPLHIQRYHGNSPQRYLGAPPLYRPNAPNPWQPEELQPQNPSEVEATSPPIVIEVGHGQPIAGQAGAGVRLQSRRIHDNKPPSKNEREIKTKYLHAFGQVQKILNPITEGLDILDAAFDAIPWNLRPKYGNTRYAKRELTVLEKVQTLYKNWEHVDWSKFGDNMGKNFFGDLAGGITGQMAGRVQRNLGLSPNSLTGALRNQRAINKAYEYQQRIKEHAERKKQLAEEREKKYGQKDASPPRPLWWEKKGKG